MTFETEENDMKEMECGEKEQPFDNSEPMEDDMNEEINNEKQSQKINRNSTDFIKFLELYRPEENELTEYLNCLDKTLCTFKSKQLLDDDIKKVYIRQSPLMVDSCTDIYSLLAVCRNMKSHFFFSEFPDDKIFLSIMNKIITIAARVKTGNPVTYYQLVPKDIGDLFLMFIKCRPQFYEILLTLIFNEISKPMETNRTDIAPYIYIGAIVTILIDDKFMDSINLLVSSELVPDEQLINFLLTLIDWSLLFHNQFKKNIVHSVFISLKHFNRYNIVQVVAEKKIKKIVSMMAAPKYLLHSISNFAFLIQNDRNLKEPLYSKCFDQIQRLLTNKTSANEDTIYFYLVKILRDKMANSQLPIKSKYELLFKKFEALKSSGDRDVVTTDMTGLTNLGSTCYLNAVLQTLFMISSFRNDILEAQVELPSITSKLQRLFVLLLRSKKSYIAPREMYANRPANFSAGQQQDCCEYLQYLLNKIQEERHKEMVTRHFYGETRIQTTCMSCNNNSVQTEPFLQLNITMPADQKETVHLLDRLAVSMQKESLTDSCMYQCNHCQSLTNAEKQTFLKNIPSNLIFNLLRYSTAGTRQKLLTSVILPLTVLIESKGIAYKYCLMSVIHHTGVNMDAGHYFTTSRPQKSSTATTTTVPAVCLEKKLYFDEEGLKIESGDVDYFEDKWMKFNDEQVELFGSREFLSGTSTPYVAFYTLVDGAEEREPQINAYLEEYVNSDEWRDSSPTSSTNNMSSSIVVHNSHNFTHRDSDEETAAHNLDKNFLEGPSYIS